MSRTREIWLFRHGETEWSRSGAHTGRTDIPLTQAGRASAACLQMFLAGRDFAEVRTSPLSRARETCRLAGYPNAVVDPDLCEWDYGGYEGMTSAEIRTTSPEWTIWTGAVPGGETIDEVARRASRIVNRVAEGEGDVALFAHGHILRILATSWTGLPPQSGGALGLDTAAISILGHEREARVIRLWNRVLDPTECAG